MIERTAIPSVVNRVALREDSEWYTPFSAVMPAVAAQVRRDRWVPHFGRTRDQSLTTLNASTSTTDTSTLTREVFDGNFAVTAKPPPTCFEQYLLSRGKNELLPAPANTEFSRHVRGHSRRLPPPCRFNLDHDRSVFIAWLSILQYSSVLSRCKAVHLKRFYFKNPQIDEM